MYDIIKAEEPDRWRRHMVRRYVVSDDPTPDFEVDAEDIEAPKDEWGYPAVAGRLSQCGGARAPHWADSQENPEGLVNHLLNVDIVEAYSPPRVTLEAKKFGLKPGDAWDLTNGWDFSRKDHQDKAEEYLEREQPLVLIGSPPCTPFRQLQSLNPITDKSRRKCANTKFSAKTA